MRATLLRTAEAAGQKVRTRAREEDEAGIVAMRKRGLTVHAVSPAILAEWHALAAKTNPLIRGDIVPAELFDQVHAHVAEFRATEGSK